MMRTAVIIQGEGKGHYSQAMEVLQNLRKQDAEITGCYLGISLFRKLPGYFREATPVPLKYFISPNFLHTPDRKGIHIFLTLLLNLFLSPIYIFETIRLGIMLRRDRSEHLINFYDPIGALAGRWMNRRSRKTIMSHHFYLSHPDFIHPHGMEGAYIWLQLMNRIMMRQADDVFALSFRKGSKHGKIRVIPPIIPGHLRMIHERIPTKSGAPPGEDIDQDDPSPDLCYFLNRGFVQEMITFYTERPHLKADIFVEEPEKFHFPANVQLQKADRDKFLMKMLRAGRVICTAGFDAVAEAFFLGLPVFVIPTENHYEQYCNALDAARTGMAYHLDSLAELDDAEFESAGNRKYLSWLETGHAMIYGEEGE